MGPDVDRRLSFCIKQGSILQVSQNIEQLMQIDSFEDKYVAGGHEDEHEF